MKELIKKIMFYYIWKLAFKIGCLRKIDSKLIVFAYNQNYNAMPDNMTALYDKFKKEGYNCIIFSSPVKMVSRMFAETKFQFLYSKAKCVFVTDYFFPLYANQPRKETKVIQLWHACGAFKKWGYSTLDLAWGGTREEVLAYPMHNTYTDVAVSADTVIPCYAEAFGCKQQIIKPLGTPRTDIYFDKNFVTAQRKILLEKFPKIGDRKIILYAPTFRGNRVSESFNEINLDFKRLKEEFGNEYALVLKLHPFTAEKFNLSQEETEQYGDFVFNASKAVKIETALCAADILISDYSSLIFEYSLLDKPMLFYSYDLEEYNRDRSFYFEYTNFIPGKLVRSNDEIIDSIKNNDFESEKISGFRNKFMNACDGKSTQRIFKQAIS
ncbi:MAG: CDP-glycerol glycerophosphotransferase family protein [Ruminococcus sp.]|nr:CDP-glycerol glycerophosphotransferase family protein [Candidatus Copronaster equi]